MVNTFCRWLVMAGAITVASACASSQVWLATDGVRLESCRALLSRDRDAATPLPPPRLTWHPSDAASRAFLSAGCATVGPGIHHAARSDSRPSPVRLDGLAVVSWNVHVGGGDLLAFVAALRNGDFTSGEPVRHFVLLVQEAFRSGTDVPPLSPGRGGVPARIAPETTAGSHRLSVVAAAEEAGLHVFYVPSMRNGREAGESAEDRGNAILSTLPLSDLTAIELPYGRQRRVAAAAMVSGVDPGGRAWRLRVVSAHLDATTGARSFWLFSSAHRQRQVEHLLTAIDRHLPTVIGADLNTWAGGPREAAATALRQAFPRTRPPGEPTFRFGRILDYLFVRLPDEWQIDTTTLGSSFGSDHRPLLARFRPARGA